MINLSSNCQYTAAPAAPGE